MLNIEFCYATEKIQILKVLQFPQGTLLGSALDFILQQDFMSDHPLTLTTIAGRVGIWGVIAPLDTILKESDRIEIYQNLCHHPNEARKLRAKITIKRR